jgi:zinc transport system ATP-binding protein
MAVLFEIDSLSAGYNSTLVLENVNFTVRENDFIGVIGPNGGGRLSLAF